MLVIRNILANLSQPKKFWVVLKKIAKRFEPDTRAEAILWAKKHAISVPEYCQSIDASLWEETLKAVADINARAQSILASIKDDLGGGGAYPLLYFLVLHKKPNVVVETGVAAGWSSLTILAALSKENNGELFSSDFPYFRMANPEKYIGILVPASLKNRWTLDVRGDDIALPGIVARVGRIDLFHYDSDKSASGRSSAISKVQQKLSANAVIVMDDIQDNTYFKRLAESCGHDYTVLEFQGKYVGLIDFSSIPIS